MNPIRSYKDFQEFMRNWRYNGKPIPVLLIRPDVLLRLERDLQIDDLFDYFNHRTGEGIVFFLPGYTHLPVTSDSNILPRHGLFHNRRVAFTYEDYHTRDPHNVHYSNRDFVNFIDAIRGDVPDFIYEGGTELLLPIYVPGENNQYGKFDVTTLRNHRYNLSELYRRHGDGYDALRAVNRFLEGVWLQLDMYHTLEDFYNAVNEEYIQALIEG